MAQAVVQADTSRYDDMETATNVSLIGGGPGASADPDIAYQGSNSVSRKVTSAGFYTSTGANRNLTSAGRTTWILKIWLTNYGSLSTVGNRVETRIGSGTGAYNAYSVANDTHPAWPNYPNRGGWILQAVDPSVRAFISSSTGTPNSSSVNYFAAFGVCSTSKVENLALDSVDVGVGLYLISGGNGNARATFQDFVSRDEGSGSSGRWAHVSTREGVLYTLGRLIIGASSSNGTRTARITEFEDRNKTLVFSENFAAPRWNGLVVDLRASGTIVKINNCSFSSQGTSSAGVSPFSDNRAVLEIYQASSNSGSFTLSGSTITNFTDIQSANNSFFEGCTFNQGFRFHLSGAKLNNCVVNNHVTSGTIPYIRASTLNNISNTNFNNSGGNGHAILINQSGTYTFAGNIFTGYGANASNNAAIFNDSGGIVVINISAGGSVPTYRNGTGANTEITASVQVTLTPIVDDSEVRVYLGSKTDPVNAVEIAGEESTSGGEFVFSHGNPAAAAYIVITKEDYEHQILELNLPSSDTEIPITQRIDRNYLNPP